MKPLTALLTIIIAAILATSGLSLARASFAPEHMMGTDDCIAQDSTLACQSNPN